MWRVISRSTSRRRSRGGDARAMLTSVSFESLPAKNVPIDFLAGTSIGAAVAGIIAAGHDSAACEKLLSSVGHTTFRPTISTKSLMSPTGLRRMMQSVWGDSRLEDLLTPLTIVATDIRLGQEVLLPDRGCCGWQRWPASRFLASTRPNESVATSSSTADWSIQCHRMWPRPWELTSSSASSLPTASHCLVSTSRPNSGAHDCQSGAHHAANNRNRANPVWSPAASLRQW